MKTSYSYVPPAAFSSQWAAKRPSPKLKIELKSAQFAKKWSEVWIVLGGPNPSPSHVEKRRAWPSSTRSSQLNQRPSSVAVKNGVMLCSGAGDFRDTTRSASEARPALAPRIATSQTASHFAL